MQDYNGKRRFDISPPWILFLTLLSSTAGPALAQQAALPVRVTLDQAIQYALQHNHALEAARSTIRQNQALEITANLRPNPTLSWDTQFLPLFNLSQFNWSYINNSAQFDVGLGYTFERGQKRQHRLQAAQDQTTVSRSQGEPSSPTPGMPFPGLRCSLAQVIWSI